MTSAPALSTPEPVASAGAETRSGRHRRALGWALGAVVIVALGVTFVRVTRMSPAYDGYGWLVWAHQSLRGTLNLNSAPSWKPLPFLFTLPYSLLGKQTAFWLWIYTAVSAGFAAPVFGGRCAYWLVRTPDRRWPAWVAAVAAGAGVLGILGYWHFILIAYADPLMVALALAAIDCHLCGRRRAAWVLITLLALGRPEAWPIGVVYGVWNWRRHPELRPFIAAGAVVVVALWVGVSRLASPYWLVSSHIEKTSTARFHLHGSPLRAVLNGFFSLYEFPVQLAALCALALALVRRDVRALWLFAVAALWLIADIALGIHGEIPSPRYMFEAAAVEVMLVAAGAGWILASRPSPALLRWVGAAAAIALVAVMVPNIRFRGRLVHNGIRLGRTWTKVITRLQLVLAHDGGTRAVLACGAPVTSVPFQSILAWEMGLNVHQVGWVPDKWIAAGHPVVVFTNFHAGWQVRVYHTTRPGCSRLVRDTPSN